MKTFVYKPTENVKKNMEKYYEGLKKDTAPPYASYQATDGDTTITMYDSGKIMFQGANADLDFDTWAAFEKETNDRDIYKDVNDKKKKDDKKKEKLKEDIVNYRYLKTISTIGSDEVGTGDYFGPMIVTACFVPKGQIGFLNELNVGDSKKITDDKILKLGPILIKNVKHSSIKLTNEKYNAQTDINMNKMKAILHNKVLFNLASDETIQYDKIVIDQFVNQKKYFEYIYDAKDLVRNILFLTKAEDKVYSVAAASVISRYLFLKEIENMSKELGEQIPLGASKDVEKFARNLVSKHGKEILQKYAKYNFKSTQNILGDNV